MIDKRTLLLSACVLALTAWAPAADEVAVQRALDKTVNIDLTDQAIGDVFDKITAAAGVPIEIDPLTLQRLPYGRQSRLNVKLKNVTLREGLSQLLARQGLTWRIDEGTVRVLPTEALARMGRRATYQELRLLGVLYAETLQSVDDAGPAAMQIARRLAGREADANAVGPLRLVPPAGAEDLLDSLKVIAARRLPASGAEWLDALTATRDWTWYPWGEEIRLLPKRRQMQRQLQTQVSVDYREADLSAALLDLAGRARVPLRMRPGVLDALPAEARENFSLLVSEASVAQVLEIISGHTGLAFTVTDEGLLVDASEAMEADAERGRRRQRAEFFLMLPIQLPDGSEADMFLRSADLPEPLREAIKASRDRRIAELLTELPEPTTRPAGATTRPAGD